MKKYYIELHILVLIFGFTAILGKLTHTSALVLVFYRTLIASFGLLFVNIYRKKSLAIAKQDILKLSAVGLILGLHWLAFFASGKLSNVSISLVTFGLTSFFTALLEPVILKKPLQKLDLGFGIMAFIGVLIIFGFESNYYWGIIVGVLSALLAALFSIFNSRLTFKFESTVISFYELTAACILMFTMVKYENPSLEILKISLSDLAWISILALVCTVYPHARMIALMRKIDVFTANLSLNLEPIYGIILAYFIFGETEKMSLSFYIGAFLIVISVFISAWIKNETKKRVVNYHNS